MKAKNMYIAPGKKLCKACKQKMVREEDQHEEGDSHDEFDINFTSPEVTREEINEDLNEFNISPLKLHSMSSRHVHSEGKRKIARIKQKAINLTENFEASVNIPFKDISGKES